MAVTKIPKKTVTLIEPKRSFLVDKEKHHQKRVAAYCRVSTDDEEQLTSYTNQKKVYTEMIGANKEWEFAGLYADEGISGTRADKRPEFQKMIDACSIPGECKIEDHQNLSHLVDCRFRTIAPQYGVSNLPHSDSPAQPEFSRAGNTVYQSWWSSLLELLEFFSRKA